MFLPSGSLLTPQYLPKTARQKTGQQAPIRQASCLRLLALKFMGTTVSTAVQVVLSWATPLLGLRGQRLTAVTPIVSLRSPRKRFGKSEKRREERDQSGQQLQFHQTTAIYANACSYYITGYRTPQLSRDAQLPYVPFCFRNVASMCLGTAWPAQLPMALFAAALARSLPFAVA